VSAGVSKRVIVVTLTVTLFTEVIQWRSRACRDSK